MDTGQNLTESQNAQEVAKPIVNQPQTTQKMEDPRWQYFISYRALNGIIVIYDEETQTEKFKKMKMQELADKLGVSRQTLYEWEERIPNFWQRVRAKKKELSSQKRLAMMDEKFFLKAYKFDNWPLTKAWMEQNNPDWRDIKDKGNDDTGDSWAELMAVAQRRRIDSSTVQEGEVVQDSNV